MKKHSLCATVLLAVMALILGGTANAQSSPVATPTPVPNCSLSPLPTTNEPPDCRTGAEGPYWFNLGVSGGNINSISSKKGSVTCCSGTLGALVENSAGKPFVLSTNYVLARTSSAYPNTAHVNEMIVQPGLPSLGCWQDTTDTVALLKQWSQISFPGPNKIDAAIARLVTEQGPGGPLPPGDIPDGEIQNIGFISTTPFPFDSLVDGLPVMKMGAGSCLTSGAIDAFDATGKVVYTKACNGAASGIAIFKRQIIVIGETPGGTGALCSFAGTGDSGALVVTQDFTCPQAIGMVFAGVSGGGPDSGATIVAVNPIRFILSQFNVSLVGQECTPQSTPPPQLVEGSTGIEGSTQPAQITGALRASIENVRALKDAYAPKLLARDEVAAVGIGAGDTPDSASLKVYLTKDSPAIRSAIRAQVSGGNVTFRDIAGKFHTL